jgi:flagellar hook-associated protein 2
VSPLSINNPIERVSRTYSTNELWFRMDSIRDDKQSSYTYMNPELPPITAPFYKFAYEKFAESATRGLAAVLSAAKSLRESTDELRASTGGSALDRRTVLSEEPEAVIGYARGKAELQSFIIDVDRVAAAQQNTGTELQRTEPSVIAAGSNRFTLTVGEKSKTLQADFWSGETNEQALGKVRRMINSADIGVTALLRRDMESGTVKLELTADETGKSRSFSITDEIGNVVEAAGLQHVTREAENASYRVNGGPLVHTELNRVVLDQGRVTAAWSKPTNGPVKLSIAPDADALKEQAGQLVKSYNALVASTEEHEAWLNPVVARRVLGDLPEHHLELLGISHQQDGSLKLDEDTLSEAAAGHYGMVSQALTGTDGLATKMGRLSEKLEAAPAFALLNVNSAPYTSLTNYQYDPMSAPPLQRYLPVPWLGTLLNNRM